MIVPISKRLHAAAMLVHQGARVADIGCDHGYLGIWLLQTGRASFVHASDLNRMPLESAMKNSEKFGVSAQMSFICAGGLDGILPDSVDTVVLCGMGGDLMRMILERAPWLRCEAYTLILQPQSGAPDLRDWLLRSGFAILQETPVREDGHMYFAMKVRYTGVPVEASPGGLYVTPAMLESKSVDLLDYIDTVLNTLRISASGMEKSRHAGEKLVFTRHAMAEILEMREKLAQSQ